MTPTTGFGDPNTPLPAMLDRRAGETPDRTVYIWDDQPENPLGRVQKFVLRERGITAQTWEHQTEGSRS